MKELNMRYDGRYPSVGITGNMNLAEERQVRKIGGSLSDPKEHLNAPFNKLSHYFVPMPMVRRLFNQSKDLAKWRQPVFMMRWRNNGGGLTIHPDVITYYQKWLAAEKEMAGVKRGNEDVIRAILVRHGVTDDFFIREPKPHQRAGLAFFLLSCELDAGHIMLFDEMRTGKTKQTIDIARFLLQRKLISNVMIVCPNSIKRVWQNELYKDAPLYSSLSTIVQGTKVKRRELWEQGFYFYISNFESVRNDAKEIYKWQESRQSKWLLVVDEAHKLKNINSLQSKVILGTARDYIGLKPAYSLFLTGTPVANTPIDVFTTCNFVCPGILNQDLNWFKNQFTVRGGYTGSNVVGYQHLDEIRWRLARVSLRRRRKDVMFDETVVMERYGKLEGKQKQAYISMRDTLYAEIVGLDGEPTAVEARNHLAKMVRLQQITSGYLSPEPNTISWFDNYGWKIKEVDDFLEDYLEDAGKVVIWSRFVPVLLHLLKRYEKYGALICRGQMGDKAIDNMYAFQEKPEHKIMLAQLQTSEGKGFQPATTAIFLDKWMSPHLNQQAADRIVGIENPVTVCLIPLITEDTIDERIEFLLREKQDWADAVTGDKRTDQITLPQLDKGTLLYLLANPDEAREYEAEYKKEKTDESK